MIKENYIKIRKTKKRESGDPTNVNKKEIESK